MSMEIRFGQVKSSVILQIWVVTISPQLSNHREIPECYEAVVIGSGFGGTIVSLTLANWFDEQDTTHKVKRVAVLERGQWSDES